MATIREKLLYAIGVEVDGAKKGLKDFRASVLEAEGGTAKLKAGFASAQQSILQNAGLIAAGAGAALVAFGAKAVAASQDVALAAGKLAESTGLTVEQASRLNEVADDLGISGETVTSVVKKMTVEIGKGNPLLEQYGIALQKTADGSADVNATLLDTIRRIGAIEDPTKRAAAAQAAFGRGYTEAAELIFSNADKLQQKLNEVSDAKVVTKEELDRARDLRDSLKNLQDVAEDLTIVAGNALVPAIKAVTDEMTTLATGAEDVATAINKIPGVPDFVRFAIQNLNPLGQQIRLYQGLADGVDFLRSKWAAGAPVADRFNDSVLAGGEAGEKSADGMAVAAGAITDVGDAAADATKEVADLGDKASNAGPKIGDMAGALDDAEQRLADLNDEARNNALNALAEAAKAVGDAVETAFDKVRDNLDLQDLVDNITDQFGEVADAAKEATDPEGIRNYNRTVRDLQRQLLTLLDSIKGIPPDKRIQIAAQIQSGDIDQLYRILGDLTKGIIIPVSFATPSTPAFTSANAVFTPGQTPSTPTFNQAAIPPTTINNVTINHPVGSTPTTQYIDQQLDVRRNGIR